MKRIATTTRIFVLGLLLAVLGLVIVGEVSAVEVTWGDTIVDAPEQLTNVTLVLDGNLTIEFGGHLEITNSTIVVNSSVGDRYTIQVMEGGVMRLSDVDIRTQGGNYSMIVRGLWEHTNGTIEDIYVRDGPAYGDVALSVRGTGQLNLTSVKVFNPDGWALFIEDQGTAVVMGSELHGGLETIHVMGGGTVALQDTLINGTYGGTRAVLEEGGFLVALSCTFMSHDATGEGAEVPDQAIALIGEETWALLEECDLRTNELANVSWGYLEISGSTATQPGDRPLPDLIGRFGEVYIDGLPLRDIDIQGTELTLVDTTFISGTVTDGAVLNTMGPIPPLIPLDGSVTLQHHYWVDFQLLNETGAPTEGLDLRVFSSGGVFIRDAMSDSEGWVRKVPIWSWTLIDGVRAYEPSHRIEFGETDFQITNVQVYDNTTVVLWNSLESRDLVLDTGSVLPSTSAPRENRTFNLIVDGETLVPNLYPVGEAIIELTIDGEIYQTRTLRLNDRDDVVFQGLNLTEGLHVLYVVVDRLEAVDEMNEGGNDELIILLDVASATSDPGDLVDFTIEINRFRDTEGNEGETLLPGIIYVDFTVRATGSLTFPRNVPVRIEVNGRVEDDARVDLVNQEGLAHVFRGRFDLNLARGDYDIRVIVDPDDEREEEFELNNVDTDSVTLDPAVNDNPFDLDPACCSAIAMVGLITAVGLLGAYSQKKQREAAGVESAETIQYPHSNVPGSTTYGKTGTYHTPPSPKPTQATSLEDRWTAERLGNEMSKAYKVDDWDSTGAERIVMHRPKPKGHQERYKTSNLRCPRCGMNDILGFDDGSAKCQSCKKIFYPGRRYR
jgi:hypothetical protein